MLFRLAANTPRFKVFQLLNDELLFFLEKTAEENIFTQALFTGGEVGQACWNNIKTQENFKALFNALNNTGADAKQRLFEVTRDHQDLQSLFENPKRNLFDFMGPSCKEALKSLCTHLYCSTKDLADIVAASGGDNITTHFNAYRDLEVNGNICKACGMKELAPFRAGIPDGDQWRSDYDHQLCKSKYPTFAVHPDNLIPLCDVCNQDAKKAKDLFRHNDGQDRLAFYPHKEEAQELIELVIEDLRDPEPKVKVKWNALDDDLLDKLETWDEIYEIRSRVEGKFRPLEQVVVNRCSTRDTQEIEMMVRIFAREPEPRTLKSEAWAFWHQKLFSALEKIDLAPFIAKCDFIQEQGAKGGEFILEHP
ncbi:hypothetical protein [Halopseudomonas bauzanensis]|uniref:hypothetical protein n=1 Tax=Halopseudomonas bauzanensis TaxID=653930 RepID=UPI002555EBE7|nr:hypothetical protein [Halopseudomonas bauzanensis]